MRLLGCCVALMLLAAGPALPDGQVGRTEPPRRRFEETLRVREILLDVTVTDRRGDPVSGLRRDDFLLDLQGRRLEVTSVTFHSSGFPQAASEAPSRPDGDGRPVLENRYFILLFHDLMRSSFETLGVPGQQALAAVTSRRWLRNELQPGDWVAIAGFDSRLKIHQDFSQRTEALERGLRRMMLRRMPLEESPAEGHPSILRHLPRGRSLRDATPRLSDALGVLAGALRSLDGRKHLFLFGIGTDLGGTVASALNRSNIDVYTVDITPPNVEHLQAASLRALARDTEGQYFAWWGPLESLRHVSRRTSGYYQVSLLAPDEWDERDSQELKVRVRDPDLRVRSRRRYPPAEQIAVPAIHTRGES